MANTIQLKRSSTAGAVPSAGSLAAGELAVNTADGKLYTKKDDGTVVAIGGGGGGSLPTGLITSGPNTGLASPDWLKCNGSVYAKTAYPALAAILGDNYAASTGSLPVSGSWVAHAKSNDVYLAITQASGNVVTSPDGSIWTQRTMPITSTSWISCDWNGSVFCAVSNTAGTTAATSPDGVTWTLRTLPTSASWTSVAWLNNQFVAVSSSAAAATSPDGATWTARTLPFSTTWRSMAYGNSLIVLVANSYILTSPDGITWTQRTAPVTASWSSVVWDGSKFVVIALGNPAVATSVDGVTWTLSYMPGSRSWGTLKYNGSTYISNSGTAIFAVSSDGVSWREFPTPAAPGNPIFWSGTKWISLVNNSSTYLNFQSDPSNFQTPAIATNTGGFSSGYAGNYYIKT